MNNQNKISLKDLSKKQRILIIEQQSVQIKILIAKVEKAIKKMGTKKILILFAMSVVLIINGCAPAYVPNVINTPLLSNKGEVQAAIHAGISGADPQFAYAITNNIGIILNGSFANRASDTTDNFHEHQFVELGTGYYTKIGESGRFETFGGLGFGNLHAKFDNNLWSTSSNVNFYRIFIQPAIGASTDIFDGSLASRFVMVNMNQGSNNSTGYFIEPVLTGKIGYKYVKVVIQLGVSFPLNFNNIDFSYQPFLFSIGLQGYIFKK